MLVLVGNCCLDKTHKKRRFSKRLNGGFFFDLSPANSMVLHVVLDAVIFC